MTNAVLYARYSTALQSTASVDDQLRMLRKRAAAEGWAIVGELSDRAISGTVRDRAGLDAALALIESGAATILLAESLDRISRDQEDIAGIFKRVRFRGARIVTVSEGDVGALHIGMGGTLSAIFLEQLADKTRRGQIGRVEAGFMPGGRSFGYRVVHRLKPNGEPERGLREIDEGEAAIVRRIFDRYAAGDSPRRIAADLNSEGVPSPRGGLWRASTITGHRQRRNGILHNDLYRGTVLFNRQTFRKDPDTRRRVARLNSAEALVSRDVPELRIVPEPVWKAVQAKLAQYSQMAAHAARRPKRLLSGLMRCGCCGSTVTVVGADRWGCSTARQTGTCPSTTTILDSVAQRRLWRALQENLLHPDVIAAYLEEARRRVAELRREWIAERAGTERRIAELDREENRLVEAISAGLPLTGLKARAEALAAEREELRARMDAPEFAAIEAAVMHPGMSEHYRRRIADLHKLIEGDDTLREKGRDLLAELVDKIELTPRKDARGADMIVHGKLASILELANPKRKPSEECMLTLVAGAGFGRWHTMRFAA